VLCALLFGAAGTTQYWQAWIYVSILFGASLSGDLYPHEEGPGAAHASDVGRADVRKEGTQRVIMVFASLGFTALLVVPALHHRFGWSAVPVWGVVLGDVVKARELLTEAKEIFERLGTMHEPAKVAQELAALPS
jgi:hypothetical protein